MTVDEAWEKVKEWNLAGKTTEAKRGCELILKHFPEHEVKSLYAQLNGGTAEPEKKGNIATKLGSSIVNSVENMVKQKKEKSEAKEPSDKKTPDVPADTSSEENTPEKKQQKPVDDFVPPEDPVTDDERIFGTIGYLWIFCIIPLLLKRDSIFVQFHAKQGLVMAVILTVFDFTIGSLLNMISGGIGFVLKLIYIGLLGYAAYNAYQGKYWKVPFVYGISRKINL